jgi:hypothetical protein
MTIKDTTWASAKRDYVEGDEQPDGTRKWPSLEDVALRFGISPSSVRHRAGKEAWKDERDIYQARLAHARQEKRVAVLAAKGAEFDGRALRIAEAILAQIAVKLKQSADARAPLSSTELQRMAQTVRVAHQAGRLAMGDTTEIQKMTTEVTPEWDLTALDDAELAQLENLQRKMQGMGAVLQ